MGETLGDMLSMTMNMGYVVGLAITGAFLLIMLFLQIRAVAFHNALFWGSIIATTTVGTEISDMIDRTFGIGYLGGSLILASGLMAVFVIWHLKEKNLRVYPLTARRQEIMFWAAVLFSNSLGTAFGDYLTDNMGLSYIEGAMVTSGIIGLVLLLHYATRINEVFLFWIAFIFTRPFGATFGDWLTKPLSHGGMDLGTFNASIVTVIIFVAVLFISSRNAHGSKISQE